MRIHFAKTHHGFAVAQPYPGSFVITTPAGNTYTADPEIVGPILDDATNAPAADRPPGRPNGGDPGVDTPPF